ncbi:hypothetical protein D5R55_36925 [Burkholderia cenocepacia]|uniref:N-ethylmaleimide reductase n=1 Tax=Burkholderia cenocepacia TaxID=95486 RepID=A0A3S9NLQ3_9BURK|nr:hypothetical protein D5R55_36925 [Burkholderia cenocepacia]
MQKVWYLHRVLASEALTPIVGSPLRRYIPDIECVTQLSREVNDGVNFAAPHGNCIANNQYTLGLAEKAPVADDADLFSIGRPFIANPDLIDRLRTGAPLSATTARQSPLPIVAPIGYIAVCADCIWVELIQSYTPRPSSKFERAADRVTNRPKQPPPCHGRNPAPTRTSASAPTARSPPSGRPSSFRP